MVFGNYAKYYNLLYKDKDYKGEAGHVHALIQQFAAKQAVTLLDIGCGTGNHAAYMAGLGYHVTGVDLSAEMVGQAVEKKIPNARFHVGNATSFALQEKFDVVTSLFHVLSYQTTNESVVAMIRNACNHLNEEGLFVFDFWYGPAVLTERPSVKVRRLEDGEIGVTRISEPVLKVNENVVEVHFDLLINDKETDRLSNIKEVHPMRYFFKPEIELLLAGVQMQPVYFQEWMTGSQASERSWGVCCVAKKSKNIQA